MPIVFVLVLRLTVSSRALRRAQVPEDDIKEVIRVAGMDHGHASTLAFTTRVGLTCYRWTTAIGRIELVKKKRVQRYRSMLGRSIDQLHTRKR